MPGAVASLRPGTGRGWGLLLWAPVLVSLLLLIVPQANFVWMSLHRNIGFGRIGTALTAMNYVTVLTDSLYLQTLYETLRLAFIATAVALVLAFPSAYALARMKWRRKAVLIDLVLVSSFVTVVVKVLGLSIILSNDGLINHGLVAIGVLANPVRFLYSDLGVIIGLVQYTLPLLILMLFGVVQTIPEAIEEAAEVHGATKLRCFFLVLVPLSKVGLVTGGLMAFNLNAGAFASALLLGGGRVLTLPVVIFRKITLDIDYPTGAALSTILLVTVFVLNAAGGLYLARSRRSR